MADLHWSQPLGERVEFSLRTAIPRRLLWPFRPAGLRQNPEESRHHLYQRLQEVLGQEDTKVLMEYLPSGGGADPATKGNLDALETRMGMRFDRVGERFADMDRRLSDMDRRWEERFTGVDHRLDRMERRLEGIPREFRSLLYALMSFMAVMVGAMVAAIKI